MNINDAKTQIKNTLSIYLKKDEFGAYKIPKHRQRPIFLLGAPGIGKTAIMAQIASELDLALVSYAMTHHTRQSALGLPFIKEKNFMGKTYRITEYTMSEIIASIYDTIEKSGKKEGILFLDEINCVSETLAPAILEFLQYKTFGRHAIPDGWLVVTAGNPPEYNKSVREMDLATMDRLKVLEVKEDYGIWRQYAKKVNLHPAITNYLDLKKKDFYRIETTIDGKEYVTARGWEDLSESLYLYEETNLAVDEPLIYQYLHHPQVAKSFATYYELYQTYQKNYNVRAILEGEYKATTLPKISETTFDEKLSLVGLLIASLNESSNAYQGQTDYLTYLTQTLKDLKTTLETTKTTKNILKSTKETIYQEREALGFAGSLDRTKNKVMLETLGFLDKLEISFLKTPEQNAETLLTLMKAQFNDLVSTWDGLGERLKTEITNSLDFTYNYFGDGELFLIFLTELATNEALARLIAERNVEAYYQHADKLKHHTQGDKLQKLAQNHFKEAF